MATSPSNFLLASLPQEDCQRLVPDLQAIALTKGQTLYQPGESIQTQDCLRSHEVPLTQEFIANMLGIRRSEVTVAAQNLQNLGVIKYSRGHITILNDAALEEMSCECYRVVQKEYLRLLGIRRG